MKRLNLSKELLFGSVLIGVLSLGLASCGGGGGGGGGGGVSTSQPSGNITSQSSGGGPPPLSYSFATYIYPGTDKLNEPIITVYIDGQPVQLLADTATSGLDVNQSAVNIPSSDYTSYTFSSINGDGSIVSGTMASATVCLNPSITNTCVVMPIGVSNSGNAFSSSSEAQGDFGLDSSLNVQDIGVNSSGSSLTGYSYPTYLAQEYGINSFTISFFPLSNTFYANVPPTTPIGEISFGTNPPSTYLPYTSMGPGDNPSTTVVFPSYTSSIPSFTSAITFFDTGTDFNYLSTTVFQTEIPNFSSSSDENNCLFSSGGVFSGLLNGGFNIAYQIPYNSTTAYYSTTFTTEPPTWFCSSDVQWNVMTGNTIDIGSFGGAEYFGLSEMLRHTFVWVLNNQGFVQGISIDP